jgi:XTP/dITP diphosphohydrolase
MKILLATRNLHKVQEIRAILGGQVELLTLNDFPGAPEVVEDAGTFAGNAVKKATVLAKWLAGFWHEQPTRNTHHADFVLADDSGLVVDALNGAPGVHSARFSALETGVTGNASTAANNVKLLRLLEAVPLEQRTARFHCVLALTPVLIPQPTGTSPVCSADEFELQTEIFEGVCEGRMIHEHRGTEGFGYDPLFVPVGYNQTFGQLGEEVKNRLSHRARAVTKLKEYLDRIAAW